MRKSTRRPAARKYISKRKAVRRAKKSNFVKAVKQVISSTEEDKMAYFNSGDNLISFNSGISGASDMQQVIPNISQGTADNARIGDQIRCKKLNIKGYARLYPKVQSGTFVNEPKLSNVMVRMMILSVKSLPSYPAAVNQPGYLSSLLKKGGTTTSFTGTLSDIQAPINSDVFTTHYDKNFYLTQDYAFLATTGSAVSGPVGIDIKNTIKFFNINLKCKDRVLKYDTVNGGILPINLGYFLVLGYAYLDGSSPDSLLTQVGLQYVSTMTYEDA